MPGFELMTCLGSCFKRQDALRVLCQERERERERKFNLSIQPALAYQDVSMLESSAKLRMAARQ